MVSHQYLDTINGKCTIIKKPFVINESLTKMVVYSKIAVIDKK